MPHHCARQITDSLRQCYSFVTARSHCLTVCIYWLVGAGGGGESWPDAGHGRPFVIGHPGRGIESRFTAYRWNRTRYFWHLAGVISIAGRDWEQIIT